MADKVITGYGQSIKFVDLGLPSGTLWASQWLGTTNDNPYGDYTYVENIKYVAENFNPDEDVIYPDCEQIDELYENVTITKYVYKDYEGVKLTSKNNKKYIILPASGYIDEHGNNITQNQMTIIYTYMHQHCATLFHYNSNLLNSLKTQSTWHEQWRKRKVVLSDYRFPILLATLKKKYTIGTIGALSEQKIDVSSKNNIYTVKYFWPQEQDVQFVAQVNLNDYSLSKLNITNDYKNEVTTFNVPKKTFFQSKFVIVVNYDLNSGFWRKVYKINGKYYYYLFSYPAKFDPSTYKWIYRYVYISDSYSFTTCYGGIDVPGNFYLKKQQTYNGTYQVFPVTYDNEINFMKDCSSDYNSVNTLFNFMKPSEKDDFKFKYVAKNGLRVKYTLGSLIKDDTLTAFPPTNDNVHFELYALTNRMFIFFISNKNGVDGLYYLYNLNSAFDSYSYSAFQFHYTEDIGKKISFNFSIGTPATDYFFFNQTATWGLYGDDEKQNLMSSLEEDNFKFCEQIIPNNGYDGRLNYNTLYYKFPSCFKCIYLDLQILDY